MEEKQKIKRKWMENEETALIQYVLEREEELFGDMKGAGSKKKAALKREGWDEICQMLNSQFISLRREPDEIKKKFFNLRQRAKEKIDFIKRALRGTGGGPAPPPLTAGEEAVALSLQNRPVAGGIDGGIDTDEAPSTSADNVEPPAAEPPATEPPAAAATFDETVHAECDMMSARKKLKKSDTKEQQRALLENIRLDNRRLELEITKLQNESEKLIVETNFYKTKTLYIQKKMQNEFQMSIES
ncbi:uncharacterized protein LOC125647757 [Ostrea edulis]|uniref:uncharacterized protein LOC125647757 n=1 Tax=Ostrea edulis TaxID=37623 RepID=UPI0024AF9B25|nr:uncharacterized protein LOC125647757 [Ostrea edulis]